LRGKSTPLRGMFNRFTPSFKFWIVLELCCSHCFSSQLYFQFLDPFGAQKVMTILSNSKASQFYSAMSVKKLNMRSWEGKLRAARWLADLCGMDGMKSSIIQALRILTERFNCAMLVCWCYHLSCMHSFGIWHGYRKDSFSRYLGLVRGHSLIHVYVAESLGNLECFDNSPHRLAVQYCNFDHRK
jgi:hypothetical protein